MRAKCILITIITLISFVVNIDLYAESREDKQTTRSEIGSSKFVVIIPERIEQFWYWYYYTDVAQYLVQSEVEKALIRNNVEIIDLTLVDVFQRRVSFSEFLTPQFARSKAKELGASFLITGKAIATEISYNVAYGINVYRSSADITAKVIRVSDGKVMAVVNAEAKAGSESSLSASRDALKEAGKEIGLKLADVVKEY